MDENETRVEGDQVEGDKVVQDNDAPAEGDQAVQQEDSDTETTDE